MSKKIHGRRYSFAEKKEILSYLSNHTYKITCEKYGISETTLSRWKKLFRSGCNINMSKIIISLPNFWLEYLNEQIESDLWEDYSDAILSIIRYYFQNQKSKQNADLKYLEKMKDIIPILVNNNPNIDSILLSSSTEEIFKTKRWKSTESIHNLIGTWKKAVSGKLKEFKYQNEKFDIRDISVKHIIGVQKSQKSNYLLGLKRKLAEKDVYILARAIKIDDNSLLFAMNALKRVAMGVVPTFSQEPHVKSFKTSKDMPPNDLKTILQRRKDYIEKSQEIIGEEPQIIAEQASGLWKKSLNSRLRAKFGENIVDEVFLKNTRLKKTHKSQEFPPRDEKRAENWLKEKQRIFQVKNVHILNRVATLVNIPIIREEKQVLEALEKQVGKKIERITADPEQKSSRAELRSIKCIEKFPWIYPDDMNFPVHKFPCHYMASNGKIIFLTLSNLNLSELPKSVFKLKSLETLFLDNNQFSTVPENLIELSKLQVLSMRNNKISTIPANFTDTWQARIKDQMMTHLDLKLNFTGNQIKHDLMTKDQIELERSFLLTI